MNNFALSDISDLDVKHEKANDKEVLTFSKKPEVDPFISSSLPDSWKEETKPDIDEQKLRKKLNITEPLDDDEDSHNNILFISDSSMPIFNLAEFEKVVEYNKDLFQNIPLDQVFQKTRYVWCNIKNQDCRYYLAKNLSKNKYNILLVYEVDKKQSWLKEVQDAFPDSIAINKNKLIAIDSFNPSHFVSEALSGLIKLSKPTKSVYSFLKLCLCSKKKTTKF